MLAQEKEVGIAELDPTITSRAFEGSTVIMALPVCVCGCVCVCVGGGGVRQLTLHCDCSTTDNSGYLAVSALQRTTAGERSGIVPTAALETALEHQ